MKQRHQDVFKPSSEGPCQPGMGAIPNALCIQPNDFDELRLG
jgi:hypothetical protein